MEILYYPDNISRIMVAFSIPSIRRYTYIYDASFIQYGCGKTTMPGAEIIMFVRPAVL